MYDAVARWRGARADISHRRQGVVSRCGFEVWNRGVVSRCGILVCGWQAPHSAWNVKHAILRAIKGKRIDAPLSRPTWQEARWVARMQGSAAPAAGRRAMKTALSRHAPTALGRHGVARPCQASEAGCAERSETHHSVLAASRTMSGSSSPKGQEPSPSK